MGLVEHVNAKGLVTLQKFLNFFWILYLAMPSALGIDCAAITYDKFAMCTKPCQAQAKDLKLPSQAHYPAAQVAELCSAHGWTQTQLMQQLLPAIATLACPPISQFYVAAIAAGSTQANGFSHLYAGVNTEFAGLPLSLVVHAEQSAIHNAWVHGETCISELVINAAPCGYCRQFINELADAQAVRITLAGEMTSKTLADYLPHAFGPEDLANPHKLMDGFRQPLTFAAALDAPKPVQNALLNAAQQSYTPYSQNAAAVVIQCHNGELAVGHYAENAAYSPSLAPLQAALNQLVLKKIPLNSANIAKVYLAETQEHSNQAALSQVLMQQLLPNTPLQVVALI